MVRVKQLRRRFCLTGPLDNSTVEAPCRREPQQGEDGEKTPFDGVSWHHVENRDADGILTNGQQHGDRAHGPLPKPHDHRGNNGPQNHEVEEDVDGIFVTDDADRGVA